MLYTDPQVCDTASRLLGSWPNDGGDFLPGLVPVIVLFSEQTEKFVPSGELSRLLATYDLRTIFDDICVAADRAGVAREDE